MEHLKKKKRFSWRDLLYKSLLFVGTVALIVYFLPRDGKFNYQFDINKPWKYGQLIATFDFPIYKEDAVVKREQDSLMAFFQPYYQLDKDIEKNAIAKLKENYHTNLKGILPSIDYLRYIERTLKEIYQAGIVSTENIQQLQKDSTSSVMVIDDKLANPQATENIYTVKKAYEHLLTADSTHFNREVLRQCALNEYITPNLTFDEERTQVKSFTEVYAVNEKPLTYADLDRDGEYEILVLTTSEPDEFAKCRYTLEARKYNGTVLFTKEVTPYYTGWDTFFLCYGEDENGVWGADVLRYQTHEDGGVGSCSYDLISYAGGRERYLDGNTITFVLEADGAAPIPDIDRATQAEFVRFREGVASLLEGSSYLLFCSGPAEDPDTQQAVENILAGLDALEARLYSNAG